MNIENFIQVEKWVSQYDHHICAGLKSVVELLEFRKR